MKNNVCCVKCCEDYDPRCFPRAKSNATADHECTLEEVPNDTGSELLIIQLQNENHLLRCVVQEMEIGSIASQMNIDLLLEKNLHCEAKLVNSQQNPMKPANTNNVATDHTGKVKSKHFQMRKEANPITMEIVSE